MENERVNLGMLCAYLAYKLPVNKLDLIVEKLFSTPVKSDLEKK